MKKSEPLDLTYYIGGFVLIFTTAMMSMGIYLGITETKKQQNLKPQYFSCKTLEYSSYYNIAICKNEERSFNCRYKNSKYKKFECQGLSNSEMMSCYRIGDSVALDCSNNNFSERFIFNLD